MVPDRSERGVKQAKRLHNVYFRAVSLRMESAVSEARRARREIQENV